MAGLVAVTAVVVAPGARARGAPRKVIEGTGKKKYGEYRIGGTSLSSPLFAGYMALADQKARVAGAELA